MSLLPSYLLSDSAAVSGDGRLSIAGLDVAHLSKEHDTPLFIYDEAHLRARCREALTAFPDGAAYAAKAFLCGAMARLVYEEGMSLDVATAGELMLCLAAGVPASSLVFHGNNKSAAEITLALNHGVSRIVADSIEELDRIEAGVKGGQSTANVAVRVNPGVEAHTHQYLQTGVTDSKFGIPMLGGQAGVAIDRVETSPAMTFQGIHAHVGSQVFDVGSFERVMSQIARLAVGTGAAELSIGGGLGVPYVEGETAPSISEWGASVVGSARSLGYDGRVTAEPGRAIVAKAAITVYTVGTIKKIDGVRTYVAVDGGMSDNPRPVLYGSGYEVFDPVRANHERDRKVRVVGKHCESGDVLVWDGRLPAETGVGDIIATPVTGAYGHSMGSNYNMILRPPVLFVADGSARKVMRRETFTDLVARDEALDRKAMFD